MNKKHRVIKEFQITLPDFKIHTLKVGTKIENYTVNINNSIIPIEKVLVDNNPEFFIETDWKSDLLAFLKSNKIPQPAIISKKIQPFIEELLSSYEDPIKSDNIIDDIDINQRIILLEKKEKTYNDNIESLIKREELLERRLEQVKEREEYINKFVDNPDEEILIKREEELIKREEYIKNLEEKYFNQIKK